MPRVVFDDATGDVPQRLECRSAPWPVSRHMTLQEIVRVRPARQVENTNRQWF